MSINQPNQNTPSLPQHDPQGRAAREQQLEKARVAYTYAHSYTYTDKNTQQPIMLDGQPAVLTPIAVLTPSTIQPLPAGQSLNIVQIFQLLQSSVMIATNFTVKLTNLLNFGAVGTDATLTPQKKEALASILSSIADILKDLDHLMSRVHEVMTNASATPTTSPDMDQSGVIHKLFAHVSNAVEDVEHKAEKMALELTGEMCRVFEKASKKIFDIVANAALHEILTWAGLRGEAQSMLSFAAQFQTMVVPDIISTTASDTAFARMRVAGPNPLVIVGISELPAKFPVANAKFQEVMGPEDSIDLAGKEGRLYLADYAVLASMKPGQVPIQKYIGAPLALFAVPRNGSKRGLKPVAIQCAQEPGAANPIFYPSDGTSWALAKNWVQAADGNYHELISHLGLTHLLVEPFAVTTNRQLSTQHPLYILLAPHFQGTLFINDSAVINLIRPYGMVDRLLGGVITSDWAVTANALTNLDFNKAMLPAALAARHVADSRVLPEYPYRDDGLLLWQAIETWVRQYLDIYYSNDEDVRTDPELQAWYLELVSDQGGCVRGLGELDEHGKTGLATRNYLTQVVTMVIFTASVQHAVVNFGQRSVMSYVPAMPLATYTPAPNEKARNGAELAQLPPLDQAAIQLILGQFLGSVYFTRLGEYDAHLRGSYFTDSRVGDPLATFQQSLVRIEQTIGARNQEGAGFDLMLPSRIPQSINI